MSLPRVLVIGGNGFLGSAICRTALAKGFDVTSISTSGRPYTSPSGHTPPWSNRINWQAGSAFDPPSYAGHMDPQTAVVHTLGILLEDQGYKSAVRSNDLLGVGRAVVRGLTGGGEGSNPLRAGKRAEGSYEGMNLDSALKVLDTMMASSSLSPSASAEPSQSRRPFVYISAADAFCPVVSSRYLESKREAELQIMRRCSESPQSGIRPLFIRPGLMYHPHIRPLSTLPAFFLSLSASLADKSGIPNIFASRSALGGAAEALRTHPLHVDHVAEAVVRCLLDGESEGVVSVQTMRQWAGFGIGDAGEKTPLDSSTV